LSERTVLIVDDSLEDRTSYRRFLSQDREARYRFLETEMGEEGLALAASERPDCVLLDYRLPDVDGLEFLARLRRDHAELPFAVLVLTGQGSESVAVEAMKNGAQDYLAKDRMTGEDLRRAVGNAIEKVALRREVEQRTGELADANLELKREIAERKRAEGELQRTHADLEVLVHHRTVELSIANLELKREVAERKRAEEERAELLLREREARQQAEEANRTKDEFLATLSHELRTPLNAMLGWAQLLRTGQLDQPTSHRALETIERNAKVQAQLISDLLDVSRIITGKLRLDLIPVELPLAVEAALDSVRPAADAKEIVIGVDLDPAAPPIMGDSDRLQQVMWNLLSNAIKFTPRGGRVEVRLRSARESVEIAVRDSGAGIRPDFLPYVFDRFRQAESTLTRSHGGLGLGLSIVRHLVEMHGGTVEAASDGEGKGATFTVRLPVRAVAPGPGPGVAAPRRVAQPVEVQAVDLAGLLVVVVDDEPDARDLLREVLEACGAEVTAAASAAEALAVIERARPDVLVSDIGMPGEDGYSLMRRVRARESVAEGHLPAAALTAYARPEDRSLALAAGYDLHLAKPIDPGELAAAVARLAARDPLPS
jgi:signal transduction histidine kinase/uncharacterized protein with PIN domain